MKTAVLTFSLIALTASASIPSSTARETPAPKAKDAPKGTRHPKQGQNPVPQSIVHDLREAVAYIAIEARKDLNPKSKAERPFWNGLKLASESIDQMEKGIKSKDAGMLKGLDGLGRAVEQIGTAWGVLRGSERQSKIGRGVIALHAAYETYLTNYGPVVARYKKGGPITAAEKANFGKAQAQSKKLKASLTKLQAKAGKSSLEARMVSDLLRLLARLSEISADNASHYCQYMHYWERFSATYYAYNECIEVWYPEFYTQWKTVYTDYTLVSTVFTSSAWAYYSGWDYTTEAITSYGDYYESLVEVDSSEVTAEESFVESYDESAATEEVATGDSELEQEVETGSADEEVEGSFSDEAMDATNDSDGDGVENDADTDDDNDGTMDTTDNDDDGDGVADTEDTDMDESADQDSGDSDDDGVSDADDTDDDNDGTMDADDSDDDGDGMSDAEDSADDSSEAAGDDSGDADSGGDGDSGGDDGDEN